MRRWPVIVVAVLAAPSYADEGSRVPGPAPAPGAESAKEPPAPPPALDLTEPLLRAFQEVIQRVPEAATAAAVDPAWLVPRAGAGPASLAGKPVVLDVPTFVAIRSEVAWAQHAVAALQSVHVERERLAGLKKVSERAVEQARQILEKDVEAGLAKANATEAEWQPKDEVERRNVERMRGSSLPRLERRFFPLRRKPRPVAAHPGWPFVAPGATAAPPAPAPSAPEPVVENKRQHRPAVLLTDALLEAYVAIRARTSDAGRTTPDASWFAGQPFDAAGYETVRKEVRWELGALFRLDAWTERRAPLDALRNELADMLSSGDRHAFDHYLAVDRDVTRLDETVADLHPTDDRERENRRLVREWRARLEGAPATAK